MPKVPIYDAPQVDLGNIPNVRLTSPDMPDVAGAQMQRAGEAMSRAGEGVQRIAETVANDMNRARLNEATAQGQALALSVYEGFSSLKGKDALEPKDGIPPADTYAGTLKDGLQKIRDGLSNDAQRAAFDNERAGIEQNFQAKAFSHRSAQQKEYEDQQRAGLRDITTTKLVSEWQNPQRADLDVIRATVADGLRGAPEEFVKSETIKAMTSVHGRMIETALENNSPQRAALWLKEFGDEMAPDVRDRVAGLIDDMNRDIEVQGFADQIMAAGTGYTQALAAARKQFSDPDARKAAVAEIKIRFDEREAAKVLRVKEITTRGWSEMMTAGGLSTFSAAVLKKDAPEEYRQMIDWQRARAANMADSPEGGGSAKANNLEAWQQAWDGIKQGDIKDAAALEQYRPFLTKETLNQFAKDIQQQKVAPAGVVENAYKARGGVIGAKASNKDREDFIAFQRFVSERVTESSRPQDIAALADRWHMEGAWVAKDRFGSGTGVELSTQADAYREGRQTFALSVPESLQQDMSIAVETLRRFGMFESRDGKPAMLRDEQRHGMSAARFYTDHGADAELVLREKGIAVNGVSIAAYTYLKAHGYPVTQRNMASLIDQMSGDK